MLLSVGLNWEQALVEINCLVFQKELVIENSLLIPLYIHHFLLSLAFAVVGGGSFYLPHGLFHSA